MKNVLWLDAVSPPPVNDEINYYWARSVYGAIDVLLKCEYPLRDYGHIAYIDLSYAAGEHVDQGGDYVKFLEFLECCGKNYPVRIHAEDAYEVTQLRQIVERNNWFEVRREEHAALKKYIFHYDDSYPSAYSEDELLKHDGQICSAEVEVHNYDKFDKVTVVFEDGFETPVIAYELEAV